MYLFSVSTDKIFKVITHRHDEAGKMSLLLKDRVYSMEAPTAKRGVYPLHGYKLGLYRLPIKLDEELEIQSVHDGLKNTFEMDMYACLLYTSPSTRDS